MRITIDALPLCGQAGGRSYLHYLTRHLFSMDGANDYSLVYRTFRNPRISVPATAKIRQKRLFIPNRVLESLWTFNSFQFPGTDALFCDPDVYFSTIYFSPVFKKAKTVTAVYDITTMRYGAYAAERKNFDIRMRNAVKRSKYLIAISEFTKKDLCEYYNVPAERVVVTPLAADEMFRPVRDEIALNSVLKRYGLKPGYILYVGNLGSHKNVCGLIEAYGELRKKNRTDVKLVLCGKKFWGAAALARISALGLEKDVAVLDYVPDQDLPFIYSGAKVFAYISLYEGFGLPILEAMQCGIPVVTSNLTSMPEVIGDAGLLVDPLDLESVSNAIARLLEDEALRNCCVKKGLERAASFGWDRTARETLEVFRMAAG